MADRVIKPRAPEGFKLAEQFLDMAEELACRQVLEELKLQAIPMRGRFLRRKIASFGAAFGTNFAKLEKAPAIPSALSDLRERAAGWAGVKFEELTQALVQKYPRGAGIGWHRDAAAFGETIVGISFGAEGSLRFRHGSGRTWSSSLPAGSIYSLTGEARWLWEHSISDVIGIRYSVTFRTMPAPPSVT